MKKQTPNEILRALMTEHSPDVLLCAVAHVIDAKAETLPTQDLSAKRYEYVNDASRVRKLIGELRCAGERFPSPPTTGAGNGPAAG